MEENLHHLRQHYDKHSLLESEVATNPFSQFAKWWQDASHNKAIIEPNCMVLSTATKQGIPSSRVVLLKSYSMASGFTFFTNLESRKAKDIAENPVASLTFFWLPLERQVLIQGSVQEVSDAEAEAYFQTRPRGSQLGAYASAQSSLITDRKHLEDNLKKYEAQFKGNPIPKPSFWGGFSVIPNKIEFWQGRPNRLHDRIVYTQTNNNAWSISRLAP